MRSIRVILLLAALAVLAGVAWAQAPEPTGHDLSWHVMSSGGQESVSTAHQVRGALGQLSIGPAAAAGGHQIGSGYWVGAGRAAAEPPVRQVYLPLVLRNAHP